MTAKSRFVAWFSEVDKEDVALVGGKGANLGEMTKAKFPVPNGFIITSNAYYAFLRENNFSAKIKHLLESANFDNTDSLSQISSHIKKLINDGLLSKELVSDVFKAYSKLGTVFEDALVAVRSSATAEDLANASFAGQQETFLNVKGEAVLLEKIKEGWAALFDTRALFYRHQQQMDHSKVGIALVVQRMVESEKSGIMFTIDPVTNDKSKIVIEAIYGLGELIVQGEENPDHYEVLKSNFSIISKKTLLQRKMLKKSGTKNKEIKLTKAQGEKQKLSDKEIVGLAKLGAKLEKHYYFPQDSEWAIAKGKLYLVQTRAVTTVNEKKQTKKDVNEIADTTRAPILKGDPASPGIAAGHVRIIESAKEIGKVMPGEVLVAPQTNPDYVPAMKKAVAIVTDSGGRTSHAAIVSRELGIPAIVGTIKATKILKEGEVVTVSGTKGEVYKGGHLTSTINVNNVNPEDFIKTATKVFVNLAEPELAEEIAKRNVDGVGLLRAEFMMAGIGTHPKKMIREGKKKIFIEKLANDLEMFCKPFNPRPVVYRASDFKTNEYRSLIGGKDFEPEEPNPMLGYRGVYRYIHDPEVFELELEAIKLVRNKKGYKNLWLMLPFVRTVKELEEVKKIINISGLQRSTTFKLWMMVEIPSNVILLEDFIKAGIDGVSIGSNDLTMLLLGTDRDNSEVASEFSELNPAPMWAFEHVIKTAHKHRITASICGQAVSTYPELVEKVVSWGVTSVSISPDAVDDTRKLIQAVEKKMIT
ncbi:MAG: phosphoenolpyruvate synthase [Patescibacteria group bacterium]|nr:phosphoenolpyruvate synthase [Patescibacteria group bacterium]